MLTLEQIKEQHAKELGYSDFQELFSECAHTGIDIFVDLIAIKYRNQGIQQASEVCCETLTDGFRISNIPAVLALKEEI